MLQGLFFLNSYILFRTNLTFNSSKNALNIINLARNLMTFSKVKQNTQKLTYLMRIIDWWGSIWTSGGLRDYFFKLLQRQCLYIALFSAFSVSASHLPSNVNISVSASFFSLPPSLLHFPLHLSSDCFVAPLTSLRQRSAVLETINLFKRPSSAGSETDQLIG